MKNIKKILSAISALGLVTTIAVSVSACSNNNRILKLPVGVTSVLGLTDAAGNPEITTSLNLNQTTKEYSWESNLVPITGKSFVNDNLTAKNEDCSSLLKSTFQLIPNPNGTYNGSWLDQITANVVYMPNISKNINNNDFYISGGTLQIQFVKDSKILENFYSVDLKSTSNESQLINSEISKLTITTNDFDTTSGSAITNPLFDGENGFKVNETVSNLIDKSCNLLSPDNDKATDNDKIIANLNKILGTEIKVQIKDQSRKAVSEKWTAQDYLTLEYIFTKHKDSLTINSTSNINPNS